MLRVTSSYPDGRMTRSESIEMPGNPGPDPWPVCKITTVVTPAAGEMFGRIGDLITLVYRQAPTERAGHRWIVPCAVNCARHGLISCERTEWYAWRAGREHLAADHPEAVWIPAAWREYDATGNTPADRCETPASDYWHAPADSDDPDGRYTVDLTGARHFNLTDDQKHGRPGRPGGRCARSIRLRPGTSGETPRR